MHIQVLVVDLTNYESLVQLDEQYDLVRSLANFPNDDFPCILIGNKLDLISRSTQRRQITMAQLQQWAQTRRSTTRFLRTFQFVSVLTLNLG